MENYREFVNELREQGSESPLKGAVAATILGSPGFVKKITKAQLGETQTDRNVPAIRKLARTTLDEIVTTVGKLIAEDKTLAKKVSIYFCHRYSGARLREVGERFGMSDAAITQASKRVRVATDRDANVRKTLGLVAKKLGIVPS